MRSFKLIIISIFLLGNPLCLKADAILGQFMPYYFFENLSYIETTQDKLLSTTNAEKVFSFDYVLNEEIFASVLATQTEGQSFNHHINVYRRSQGYALVDIETVDIEEYTFLLSKYLDTNEEDSYVVAFSMEYVNGELDLHSHWSPNQINTIHTLYNYEIVFSDRDDAIFFIPLMIKKIKESTDLNMVSEDLVCPKLYVSRYDYLDDKLQFTIHNELGNEWIDVVAEDLNFDVLLEEDIKCEVSFPWDKDKGVIMEIHNTADYQDDLLYISENRLTTFTIDHEDFDFEIFPNPSTDYINVKANGCIQLVDHNGHTIYSIADVQGQIRLDLSNLASGPYYLIFTNNSKKITKKVIVI